MGPAGAIGVKVLEWLRQEPFKDEAFVQGSTVRELAARAGRNRDAAALAEVLEMWRQTIDAQRTPASDVAAAGMRAFLTRQPAPWVSAHA